MTTKHVTRQAITIIDHKIATLTQLRKALLQLGSAADSYHPKRSAKRRLSKASRKKISLAQKRRWSVINGGARKKVA